ncbi:glycoside hydrolase family 16 protein [Amylostereum chailletii]|nr:glycoside hydrolase family 16 protein [Amylostereum chailletii]
MYHTFSLLALAALQVCAIPNAGHEPWIERQPLVPRLALAPETKRYPEIRATNDTTSSNASNFLWLLQDTFDGSNFFDNFAFFTGDDPTQYVDKNTAFANNLSYVSDRGTVIMKGDNTTWLPTGQNRQSVRVSSFAQYTGGLFILDSNKAPWGCVGVWPAFWTLGADGTWPQSGEIDVLEGVHDNEHNQVTWHTRANCSLTATAPFTGSVVQSNGVNYTDCEGGTAANKPGCGIIEWSRATYGPTFDAQGGGVFAMKWDQDGIAVWSFYRVAVPQDIKDGTPDPSGWGSPSAALSPQGCDIGSYFYNHSIIFAIDITFCGDWAGNSYATSGCPGTCPDRLVDPSNFDNATWDINWLRVYRRQTIPGVVSEGRPRSMVSVGAVILTGLCVTVGMMVL